MKKNKILCFVLILITIFTLPVYTYAYNYLENDVIIDFIPGDIDNNEKVNSADARLCLRAAAQLETLSEKQLKAVDFDGTGEINSATARQILRASAKLETLTYTVSIQNGQRIVLVDFDRMAVYDWVHDTDSSETEIIRTSENEFIGDMNYLRTYHTITTNENDSFKISFVQSCPWNGKINNSFDLNIVI